MQNCLCHLHCCFLCKASLSLGWLTHTDVQTRWLWRWYGCKKPGTYAFMIANRRRGSNITQNVFVIILPLFPDNNCPPVNGFQVNCIKMWQRGTFASSVELQIGPWHKSPQFSVSFTSLNWWSTQAKNVHLPLSEGTKGCFLWFSPAFHCNYINVVYIFLWGNEPLTFSSKW